MVKPRYEAILVKRVPNISSAPTLTEIDEIIVRENLAWSTELIGDGGFISFALEPDQQSQDIKDILVDISQTACEIRLYRNGTVVQMGPIIGVQTQGPTVNIVCRAAGYYLKYMFIVVENLQLTNVDQYTIGKRYVDDWQALDYGNFGLDTSGIGTSGIPRSVHMHGDEAPNVLRKLELLADNLNGFEFYVDPITRALVFTQRRGSDKSADVIIDSRAIVSPNTHFSVAFEDYANAAIAIGADQDASTGVGIRGYKNNVTEQAIWGRAGAAIHIDSVTEQGIIDDYAQSLLDTTDHLHFIPGTGSAFPILGAGVEDFDTGDTITWVYDYGLGLVSLERDVYKRIVKIDGAGTETMSVEFV